MALIVSPKYEHVRFVNLRAENRLRHELFDLDKLEKENIGKMNKEAINLKMELRAQRFRVFKNDLQRKINEKEAARKQTVNSHNRSSFWLLKSKTMMGYTPSSKISAAAAQTNAGFASLQMSSDHIDSETELALNKHRPKEKDCTDYYMTRLMNKLKSQVLATPSEGMERGNTKQSKYLYTSLLEKLKEEKYDEFNNGMMVLSMRRFQKKQRDAIPWVAKNRKATGYNIIDVEQARPPNCRSPYNGRFKSAPACVRTFQPTKLDLLSRPKLSTFTLPTVSANASYFIPKTRKDEHSVSITKEESDSLRRIHIADQKAEYARVQKKVNEFLGKEDENSAMAKQHLTDEESLVYKAMYAPQTRKARNVLKLLALLK